ncbi:MAG: site-specific integrase [Anaerovoracaceae bacterium]
MISGTAPERKLSENTLKSYRIVLNKFRRFVRKNMQIDQIQEVTKEVIRVYLEHLNESWKSSTARHHINVVQGFFSYLEENEIIEDTPFRKMHIRIRRAEAAAGGLEPGGDEPDPESRLQFPRA